MSVSGVGGGLPPEPIDPSAAGAASMKTPTQAQLEQEEQALNTLLSFFQPLSKYPDVEHALAGPPPIQTVMQDWVSTGKEAYGILAEARLAPIVVAYLPLAIDNEPNAIDRAMMAVALQQFEVATARNGFPVNT